MLLFGIILAVLTASAVVLLGLAVHSYSDRRSVTPVALLQLGAMFIAFGAAFYGFTYANVRVTGRSEVWLDSLDSWTNPLTWALGLSFIVGIFCWVGAVALLGRRKTANNGARPYSGSPTGERTQGAPASRSSATGSSPGVGVPTPR